MQRRKKVAAAAAQSATSPSNLEDTNQIPEDSDENAERWAGDPDEEPEPTSEVVEPAAAAPVAPARRRKAAKPPTSVQTEIPEAESVAVPAAAPTTNGSSGEFPAPWGHVVGHVFNIDVEKTYQRLNVELTLGDKATEYGSVIRALDDSARRYASAVQLARVAKLADEDFAVQLDKRLEVLRTEAARLLEVDKAEGRRSKAPTIQDITDRMLSEWPDEVTALKQRKGKMHAALRTIEGLEEAWKKRCGALEVMGSQAKRVSA